MSDEDDRESRTEEATEKRLSDALDRGATPFSQDATLMAALGGMLVVAVFVLPTSAGRLVSMLVHFIDDPSGWVIADGGDAMALWSLVAREAALSLIPIVAVLLTFGLTACFAQNAPRLALDRIRPQFSRISPREGLSRLFGPSGWTNFLKNILKFVAVSVIAAGVVRSNLVMLTDSVSLDVMGLPHRTEGLAIRILAGLAVATVVVGCADLVWARLHWRRNQRMSRQEIREEMKQIEGDPLLKARLRSIRMDRARKRMLTAVPKATMVIVNPTHYAVALRYVRSEGGAPIVVAKGLDLIALRIRAIAEEHRIAVVEDKPLARSLYAAVKVDKMIPPEFYRAVAEVIHLIHKRKASGAPVLESKGDGNGNGRV